MLDLLPLVDGVLVTADALQTSREHARRLEDEHSSCPPEDLDFRTPTRPS